MGSYHAWVGHHCCFRLKEDTMSMLIPDKLIWSFTDLLVYSKSHLPRVGLQLPPLVERLGEVEVPELQLDLAQRIILAQPVPVKHLHVQGLLHDLIPGNLNKPFLKLVGYDLFAGVPISHLLNMS